MLTSLFRALFGAVAEITFLYYFWVIQSTFLPLLNRDAGVHSPLCFPVFKHSVLPITFCSHLLSQSLWVKSVTSQTPSWKVLWATGSFCCLCLFLYAKHSYRLGSERPFVRELMRTECWKPAERLFFISVVSLTPPNPYLMTCCSWRDERQRFASGNIRKLYILLQLCTENCLLFIAVLQISPVKLSLCL